MRKLIESTHVALGGEIGSPQWAFPYLDDEHMRYASGLLAAGGTIANLTALTAARERAVPGVRHEGAGERRMALYCSAEAHYSVRRAAELR